MIEVLTEQAREELVAQAVAAARSENQPRTERVNWKDGQGLLLPVVRLPLSATVLNPGSHRIASDVEALGDAARSIHRDPYGQEAQETIAGILRSTQGFEGIKVALERDTQLHPGVLTSKGILVNANTRRVALEDLGQAYIDVVVLPSDATEKEITDLELDLQMQMDVKQEYSFTARLLFISKLVLERGLSAEEVGLRLDRSLPDTTRGRRDAQRMVEQELRLLRLIREVVEAGRGTIGITKFDHDRQVLIEIDEDYEKNRKSDPGRARQVRDAQLACLIANVRYKKIRKVDNELVTNYLRDALSEQRTLEPFVEDLLQGRETQPDQPNQPDGLGILEDFDESGAQGPDTTRLFNLLVTAPHEGDIVLRDRAGSDVEIPSATVFAAINAAFMVAIEAKERDGKDTDRLHAPAQMLREAARLLDKASAGHDEVVDEPEFDGEEFAAAVAAIGRAWDEFKMTLGN